MRTGLPWQPLVLAGLLFSTPTELRACTVFSLWDGERALMANNEDFNKRGAIWFVPPAAGKLGRVNVGFHDAFGKVEDFAQGGINTAGLAFDAMVVAKLDYHPDPAKQTIENLPDHIMDRCRDVEEAIEQFRACNCPYLATTQFLFADATGASAVIAWDPERQLTVTRGTKPYQIATNTRLAMSGYRCQRSMRVQQMLSSAGAELNRETARRALQAVHQRGPGGFTSYSCVYDLSRLQVYLYNMTNFDEVVRFDMASKLAQGPATHRLKDLFRQSPSLREVTAGQQRTEFDTRIELSRGSLEAFAGVYAPEVAPQSQVTIEATDDGLRVHHPGRPTASLYPESETVFRIAPDRGQVRFHVSAAGTVTGLTLHKQRDVHARRITH